MNLPFPLPPLLKTWIAKRPWKNWQLDPLTKKKIKRFREIRRGYFSFLILAFFFVITFYGVGELFVNNRALMVWYEGKPYFPTYAAFIPGTTFGEDYAYETNYRDLQARFAEEKSGNWVIMPLVPYGPNENDFRDNVYGPRPPSAEEKHFLGTDNTGRDILARLFYGFRNAIVFALLFTFFIFLIATIIGCAMGYFGGTFDLIMQRITEIVSVLPFLYIVIIVGSIIRVNLWILLVLFSVFYWTGMTYYMRTNTYKEKARDYISAAKMQGASTWRIIIHHVLPNTISTLVTFFPFMISIGISNLTALDFLGYGLQPPTPSWGELLKSGLETLNAPWIVTSAFLGLVLVLILVTFVGEAIREAFDPKKYTVYR